MSVPKSRRGESKFEVLIHATKLRKAVTLLLLRDLGIKKKIRDYRSVADFEPDDKAVFENLAQKYDFKHTLIAEYPEWLINHFRETMINITTDMIKNITAANTIYVTNESEYNERRSYQTAAICNCENLLQELQYVASLLCASDDMNKYKSYVEMTEKQIALLRAWRTAGNKLKKNLG